MSSENLSEQVYQVLREKYQRLDDSGDIAISPALLAEAAYRDLDPDEGAPLLVRWACVMELRQLARSLCRRRIEEQEQQAETVDHDLFPVTLQDRYPARRQEGEVYVLRAHLTAEEYDYNIARLRSEGEAKLKHADALDAEKNQRLATGNFAA